jgi:hypothetical protein
VRECLAVAVESLDIVVSSKRHSHARNPDTISSTLPAAAKLSLQISGPVRRICDSLSGDFTNVGLDKWKCYSICKPILPHQPQFFSWSGSRATTEKVDL